MRALRSSLFVLLLGLLLPGVAAGQAPKLPQADVFFTDPALGETRALMVVQDGRVLYERYAPGYGPANRFISWSMAKSITATLVGELVADGRLELDLPAPVPAWRQRADDPRARITLRHLLHMAAGLRHVETGPAPEKSDTNRALFSDRSGDIVAAATMAPLVDEPGKAFLYSTLTSHILADIITRTVAPDARTANERRRAVKDFIDSRLAGPAAMPTLLCEFDPKGTLLGGSFCHASLRDWAAFGALYLNGGRVAGREVVRPEWVAFVRTPSPANPGYGGHFWLNLPVPKGRESALFADQGPADAFAAIGHLGQYVIIVPSKRLVVVRLGFTPDDRRGPLKAGLGRLVNSLPDMPGGP